VTKKRFVLESGCMDLPQNSPQRAGNSGIKLFPSMYNSFVCSKRKELAKAAAEKQSVPRFTTIPERLLYHIHTKHSTASKNFTPQAPQTGHIISSES
jgi:hypothetical protein